MNSILFNKIVNFDSDLINIFSGRVTIKTSNFSGEKRNVFTSKDDSISKSLITISAFLI